MKVRRDIASSPHRTAKATWARIVDLITGQGSVDREQLEAAASVMEALIAEEHPRDVPIVVKGGGPRLVLYLRYDSDALDLGDQVDALSWNPTEGDWSITAPTAAGDVTWMNDALTDRAPRISVHDVKQAPQEETEKAAAGASLTINWGVLG